MSTVQRDAEVGERLGGAGLRITAQRLSVLKILEGTRRHLDAETIYALAREQGLKLSLATVYRTLSALKAMGLVEQRYLARDHKREYYESTDKPEHYHFTCLGCGRTVEVRTPRIRQAKEELSRELGLVFTHACVCLEGYCVSCAAERTCRSVVHPPGEMDDTASA